MYNYSNFKIFNSQKKTFSSIGPVHGTVTAVGGEKHNIYANILEGADQLEIGLPVTGKICPIEAWLFELYVKSVFSQAHKIGIIVSFFNVAYDVSKCEISSQWMKDYMSRPQTQEKGF